MQITQKYVGWLKGVGSGQLDQLQRRTGARVRVDQSTREAGYSVMQITGMPMAVASCKALIEDELFRIQERDRAVAVHSSVPGGVIEVVVPQQYVGWIKGTGGAQIKELERRSGAHITIDQSTQDAGYSRALLHGDSESTAAARQLIEMELQRVQSLGGAQVPPATPPPWHQQPRQHQFQQHEAMANPSSSEDAIQAIAQLLANAAKNVVPTTLSPNPAEEYGRIGGAIGNGLSGGGHGYISREPLPAVAQPPQPGGVLPTKDQDTLGQWYTLVVPNTCVGWLKGKQGQMIREIQNRSGAQIDIDQGTRELGQSVVQIHGQTAAQMKMAYGLIVAEVMKVLDGAGEAFGENAPGTKAELRIDSHYVGWVKGPRGKVVQDIQSRTGTRIDMDQTRRDLGFATVKIFGTHEGTQFATREIARELSKINPEAAAAIVENLPVLVDGVAPPSWDPASASGHQTMAQTALRPLQRTMPAALEYTVPSPTHLEKSAAAPATRMSESLQYHQHQLAASYDGVAHWALVPVASAAPLAVAPTLATVTPPTDSPALSPAVQQAIAELANALGQQAGQQPQRQQQQQEEQQQQPAVLLGDYTPAVQPVVPPAEHATTAHQLVSALQQLATSVSQLVHARPVEP
eukprot:NODE_1564_length_2436_cov_16.255089.p1 GENE.NODE_1564_length_2436_cov_16.255089~~NODE_1564_length_2436_cov_16.255089.p1  ORF type:complete len:633 (+),score=147.89 NODE_1564_length_2436_cov_16.255089:293-2191(+)